MIENFNFSEMFHYFKQNMLYFLLVVVGVVILGGGSSFILGKPQYTSTTSLSLAGVGGSSDTITANDITLNSKLVSTYQEIIKSRTVLNQVISNLRIDRTVEDLASNITVKSVTDSIIIKITVTDENSNQASNIANELASVFSKEVKDRYNITNVSILDRAIASSNSDLNIFKNLFLYLIAGCFLAFSILLICYYFDTTLKSSEQVEKKFNFVVLGAIPDYNVVGKNNKKKGGRI